MKIGELARRSGLTVHAIRWYETQRLIPGVRRDTSGHREYIDWHVSWLALLDRLKLTGMSIAQMAAYTALVRKGESTLAQQRRMFVEHRDHAAQGIAARQKALEHIDHKIRFLDQWIETGKRPPIAGPVAGPIAGPSAPSSPGAKTKPVKRKVQSSYPETSRRLVQRVR